MLCLVNLTLIYFDQDHKDIDLRRFYLFSHHPDEKPFSHFIFDKLNFSNLAAPRPIFVLIYL
jgi:hypothetical protein